MPSFDRCLQALGTFSAQAVGTWTSNTVEPFAGAGAVAVYVSAIANTPSVDLWIDTYDGQHWIPLHNAKVATFTPTAASSFVYSIGPGTANNDYILGYNIRVRLVVSGASATITGYASFITNSQD